MICLAEHSRHRETISYSAMRTFQACPLRYRYRYIDRLPERSTSASLVFGSAIHAAIEAYFQYHMAGSATPQLEALLEIYRFSWQDNAAEQIHFGASESYESLEQLAARMLECFLASSLARPEGLVIGVEEELRGELVPGIPELLGRIDLLLVTEQHVIIQDFKTARSVWSPAQAYEQAEQLLLYGELVRKLLPERPLRLRFAVITKTKTPQGQLLEAPFDEARLARTKQVLKSVWSAIEAGHFYPAPSPMQCTTCGYRSQCAAWRG